METTSGSQARVIIRAAFPFNGETSFTGPAGRHEYGSDVLLPLKTITLDAVIGVLEKTPGIVSGIITPHWMRLDVDTRIQPALRVVDNLASILCKLFEHSGHCEIVYP